MISAQANRLPRHLEEAGRAGVGLVVIDTAPHSEAAALAAARSADLMLIPCRPAILDLRAIGDTIDLTRLAATPAAVVLSAVPPRGTLADEAAAAVAGYAVPLSPGADYPAIRLHPFPDRRQGGAGYEPWGKAVEEVLRLFDWLRTSVDI